MAKAENNAATESKKQINWRDYERGNDDVKKAEVLKIPLDRIRIKKGFNPRDINKPETRTKIENIKAAYKSGEYVKPIEVSLASDGEVDIVDGHCRYTAAMEARKELVAEGLVDALKDLICVPFKGNDLDRLAHTVLGNEGEKLTPLECSEVVKRMQGLGLNREQIAERLRFTIGWVDRLIVMYKLPQEVKNMIRDGKVSPEAAAKMVRKHGEENAVAAINGTLKSAEANGESKVTEKHLKDKVPADDKTKKKEIIEAKLTAARDVAFLLPEKLTKARTIVDDKDYPITVKGSALKAMMQLQDQFAEEIGDGSAEQ